MIVMVIIMPAFSCRLFPAVFDEDAVARSMSSAIRVLCLVVTTSEGVSRAASIKATWGRRCNDIVFMSDQGHDVIDGVPAVRVDSTSRRTASAFDYVFEKHINDADWFLQVETECRHYH